MNWKCFLGIHDWNLEAAQTRNFHRSGYEFPTRMDTIFLWQCKKCKNIKTKVLNGHWKVEEDDDDGDRDPPIKGPQMTPDDFYASLENK